MAVARNADSTRAMVSGRPNVSYEGSRDRIAEDFVSLHTSIHHACCDSSDSGWEHF